MGARVRFPEAWFLLVAGLCILAGVTGDVAYFSGHANAGHSAEAVNAQYPLPELAGVLTVHDRAYSNRAAATVGGPCKGLGAYAGLLGGTPVVVKDQSGAVVATAALDIGKVTAGSTCEFAFVVQGMPKADAYEFEILNHIAGAYRYADLDARGWDVALSLG